MIEQAAPVEDHEPGSGSQTVRTGVPAVDQVLDAVDQVEGAPLEEHLAVFERAHTSLRAALDDVSSRTPDGPSGAVSGQPDHPV